MALSQIIAVGTSAPGFAATDSPVYIGGSDGTNMRGLSMDTSGHPQISGAAATGSAVSGNPVMVGGSDGSNARTLKVNAAGQASVNTEGLKASYSFAVTGFTPVATPTDILEIVGSASKTVKVTRIQISGAATAGTTIDVLLIKRSAADTGSTPVALTAIPHDSADSAATAVVHKFTTTNPTAGAAVGTVRAQTLGLATVGGTLQAAPTIFTFGKDNDQALTLRGVAETLAINWGGVAVPGGTVLDIDVTLTEE